MPSWNVHLEAGNRVAKKLKLSGEKKKEFLFGCILPDVNNGYINRVKTEKPHDSTHYAYNQKSSLNFYANYKKEVDKLDPICLGYLLHLYTDGYFNYDFYRTIKRVPLGEGLEFKEKQTIKHHDFWLYDLNFKHHLNIKDLSEARKLANSANRISAVKITPEDILDVESILVKNELSEKLKGSDYIFYTKERLDQLMDDMIKSFSNDYLGAKNA
ncbi:zinc dependent phospholipase C family protein [Candidatus Saccharibacteria bacterium]|nr:zinc dependent phospholipase C family protein [Candidatus Saccharibacteria bacterium]